MASQQQVALYNVFQHRVVRDQLIANTVLTAFATLMVVLRFVARRIRRNRIWWDDACCVGSLLHTYGMLGMHYHYARLGMRNHMADMPPINTVRIFQMLIAYQLVYYNAMLLAKLTYLIFYQRIFISKPFRVGAWICTGCACAYWLGSTLQVFLICQPFAYNWDQTIAGGHCASQNVAFSTIGAFNLVTDLAIILLPVRFISTLQMTRTTKWGLYAVFCVGVFISAITIIRIRVLTTVDFTDLPYSMIDAAFWSVAEPAVAVANACVPMLRPVITRLLPSTGRWWWSSVEGGTSGKRGSESGRSAELQSQPLRLRGRRGDKTASALVSERIRDGEFPLTQFEEEEVGGGGAGGGGVSTVDVRRLSSRDDGSWEDDSRMAESRGRSGWKGDEVLT